MAKWQLNNGNTQEFDTKDSTLIEHTFVMPKESVNRVHLHVETDNASQVRQPLALNK